MIQVTHFETQDLFLKLKWGKGAEDTRLPYSIKNTPLLGPYIRIMPRGLGGS
jgi:hypothetical protein